MIRRDAGPRSRILPIVVAALHGLAMTSVSPGDVIELVAAKDNSIYTGRDSLDNSNGAGEFLFAGRNNQGNIRRGLVMFDIAAAIPAGSVIDDVTLQLFMVQTQSTNALPVDLYRLEQDWGEAGSSASPGGQGAEAEPGDATWSHAFYRTTLWTTPGGEFSGTASATTFVDVIFGPYTWSSPQMIADVQAWLDAPGTNYGWIVRGVEFMSQTARRFVAREGGISTQRPKLTITFTPPDPTGGCCLPGGLCQIHTSSACAMNLGTYLGDGSDCTGDPCLPAIGACCHHDATCSEELPVACAVGDGTFQGNGTSCLPGLCPVVLEPFVDPLPIPPVAQPTRGSAGGTASYEIAITQFQQQLHRDLPPTTLWGYDGMYPGPTIEAATDKPVTVNWISDLRDESNRLLTVHYLPVDLCLHGPNMEGPSPRTVVHLHGAHTHATSDGYPEDTLLPGESQVFVYPNHQLPATLWYHDHALGITRLNVYLGLAGFYMIRDAFEADLALPSGAYEIPLVIQDRTFNPDGTLQYPVDWEPHFFGDTVLVNGKVWPFLNVKRGKYRFRILNGSGSRTYTLALSNGAAIRQIGTDGGLLQAPVALNQLTLAPAERADVVIDFASYAAGTEIVLTNSAPAPFPGNPGLGVIPEIMKFIVTSDAGVTTPLPAILRPLVIIPEEESVASREFQLRTESDDCTGFAWRINGLGWHDITEFPVLGTTEIWSFINRSGMMHPMHMHLVMFQVLDRQPFMVDGEDIVPIGVPQEPPANEIGWKDTVRANPLEITRVIARFEDYTGKFPYHCHIIEHEDHDMMRQFEVVAPCIADLNLTGDGQVNAIDLAILLGAWGLNPGHPADLNDDGGVNAADLALLLGAWGPCP